MEIYQYSLGGAVYETAGSKQFLNRCVISAQTVIFAVFQMQRYHMIVVFGVRKLAQDKVIPIGEGDGLGFTK